MKIGDKVLVRATIIEVDPATSDKYFVRVQFCGDNKKEWIVSQDVIREPFDWKKEGYVCQSLHRVPIAGCADCDKAERK